MVVDGSAGPNGIDLGLFVNVDDHLSARRRRRDPWIRAMDERWDGDGRL